MKSYLLALRGANQLSRLALAPWGRLHMRRRGATVVQNLAYGPLPQHKLDIYLPKSAPSPCPVVFYLHGGGFTALSKDSHHGIARELLKTNVAVVLADYRLAPEHPFPAALEDAAAAWCFIVQQAASRGLDPQRIVLAGESAGANLALGIALAACAPLRHPAVAAVRATGIVPRAVMPLCGLLQVSDPGRYRSGADAASAFVQGRLASIAAAYLEDPHAHFDPARALADPLVMLERGYNAETPLPATFIAVGADDPLVPDSRRLAEALKKRGAPHSLHTYPKAGHAFFAVRRSAAAQAFWRDAATFIAAHTQPPS